ncbi:MAG: hypothetical protein ACRDIL_15830, partial [Candidatus Limnocylindrales bacterium]
MTPPRAADLTGVRERSVDGPPAEREGASFRDPSAFVFWRDGRPYRQIQRAFAVEWDAFESSALKGRLLDDGWIVP